MIRSNTFLGILKDNSNRFMNGLGTGRGVALD
jgi:hypothetical protein